jgi:hypothetical protein
VSEIQENKKNHKPQPIGLGNGGQMPKHAPVFGIPLVLITILSLSTFAFVVGTMPIFPRVSVTFEAQSPSWGVPPSLALRDAKLDRLTLASASSVAKNRIFLYPISTQPTATFDLALEASYSDRLLASDSWEDLPIGLYSFTVVFYPTLQEQQAVYYHVKITATFQYGAPVVIEADVPPS